MSSRSDPHSDAETGHGPGWLPGPYRAPPMCDAHVARLILRLRQRTGAVPLDWEMPRVAETLHSGLSALGQLSPLNYERRHASAA